MRRPRPIAPGPGQESVWDYPRPAILQPVARTLEVVFAGRTIARTTRGHRVLETSHPPTYYLPPDDVLPGILRRLDGMTTCEWKGRACYFDVVVDGLTAHRGAWSYPITTPPFDAMKDHIGFYAGRVDACFVDGEQVVAQPGDFYAGWITREVVGPFKGGPGTWGW